MILPIVSVVLIFSTKTSRQCKQFLNPLIEHGSGRKKAKMMGEWEWDYVAGGGGGGKYRVVKTFLPGFGNGWLKYCAIVVGVGSEIFWEWFSELRSNVFTQLWIFWGKGSDGRQVQSAFKVSLQSPPVIDDYTPRSHLAELRWLICVNTECGSGSQGAGDRFGDYLCVDCVNLSRISGRNQLTNT